MPHPPKGESACFRVYSMGRVWCPCGCQKRVWRIEYTKGEPIYEDDYGDIHRVKTEAPAEQAVADEPVSPMSLDL